MGKKIIKICTGGACSQNLSSYLFERAKNDIEFFKMHDKVEIQECPCQGNCEYGPTILVEEIDGSNKQQFSKMNTMEMGKVMKKIKNNQMPIPYKRPPIKN